MSDLHTDRLDDLGLDRVLLTLACFFLALVLLALTHLPGPGR